MEEVLCFLDEHYGDGPRSVLSYALEAMTELLRVQLRLRLRHAPRTARTADAVAPSGS